MVAEKLAAPPKKSTRRTYYNLTQYITGEVYKFTRGVHYETRDEVLQSNLYKFAKRYSVQVRVSIPEPGVLVFQFTDPQWGVIPSFQDPSKPREDASTLRQWQFKKWGDRDGYTERSRPAAIKHSRKK
jgi:hypothetical protein